MATSAFRSNSRRATATEPKSPPPAASSRRRSHSVSAVSRKNHAPFDDSDLVSGEFSNSRDNPLFWGTSSSPPGKEDSGKITEIGTGNSNQTYGSNTRNTTNSNYSSNSVNEKRGRSFTRSSSEKKGIGRSLSRVRGRSVSRAPPKGAIESEKEQDMGRSAIASQRNVVKRTDSGVNRTIPVRNRVDTWSRDKTAGVRKIKNQATEWSEDASACSLPISNLEDGISVGSLSEAEEKTIKPVCEDFSLRGEKRGGDLPPSEIYETVRSEVRRAISDIQNDLECAFRRKNANIAAATNDADTPSDLVNPEPVELISDIRREYAVKLEESEERARKLRADLAFEEQHAQELDRILKEIIPDPTTSGIQRSYRGRRTSNERKRISRRLTDEAMAYFDECVSISTFDSSDFSATEDPPYNSVPIPVGSSSLVNESSSKLSTYDQSSALHHKQLYGCEESALTAESSTQLCQFSFASKRSENVEPQQDITSYIKSFKKGPKQDDDLEITRSYYDAAEYSTYDHMESVLIDRVLYNSRIESGGLILCGGAASFLPFASVM